MRIDRRLLSNMDWPTFGIILTISALGIMTIFSATRPLFDQAWPSFYMRQAYWLLIGLGAMALVLSIDYTWFHKAAPFLYAGGLVLLVMVFFLGRTGMGAKRWIAIAGIQFQPSELFKLAYLIVISRYLSGIEGDLRARHIITAFFAFTLLPMALIMKQPDLGTSVILLGIFILMVLAKGVGRKFLIFTVLLSLVIVPFAANIAWDHLKDYQKKRIVAFIEPDSDPEGMSYHINQSKVAVGSGGLFGKGYLQGTQGPFRFLPEKHTDFIFSIFAEEWGFAGCLALLGLYFTLLHRGLDTAEKAKDDFGRMLAMGITFMFFLYCVINVSMTVGLMPVVGVPLPFMSYGGTALAVNFLAAGLLINIRTRRFELFY